MRTGSPLPFLDYMPLRETTATVIVAIETISLYSSSHDEVSSRVQDGEILQGKIGDQETEAFTENS